MCGIAGFLEDSHYHSYNELSEMANAISHRGPDSFGVWFDKSCGIGLAHSRLAIVDLTSTGHQPMISATGKFVISFNGEIYNHLELRNEIIKILPELSWKGHSDTETLLAGFEVWGITETIKRSTGMFAFAVWDTETKNLILGRDRFGEKPLYYGWQDDHFLFASELKALKKHPSFVGNINRDAISLLLRHNCIPAPHSIYRNIYKLMPGFLASISLSNPVPKLIQYWSTKTIVEQGIQNQYKGTIHDAKLDLELMLRKVLAGQMMADVSLGAFLSGGVDSSTIVALMQTQSTSPIKTFSIGFDDEKYNEAHFAKSVAEHLGTNHTEFYLRSKDALAVIPKLAAIYDEPFADASQIPTYLVSKMARQHVTVSLSGDAGDELFCGYTRYLMVAKRWSLLSRIPIFLRRILASSIKLMPPNTWTSIDDFFRKFLFCKPASGVPFGDKLYKVANVLVSKNAADLYRRIVSINPDPLHYLINASEPLTTFLDDSAIPSLGTDAEKMMSVDMVSYLSDDILTKVDRAAMAVSLETRVPFLDHRLVEFVWSLPFKYKFNGTQGKWILREILYKYVPKHLIERPKMGFAIPIDTWLRGPLKNWGDDLLDKELLIKGGFLNAAAVRKLWDEHQSGHKNNHYQLWSILMFQAWLKEHHNPTQE